MKKIKHKAELMNIFKYYKYFFKVKSTSIYKEKLCLQKTSQSADSLT